jgi:ParB-like nuclease domain
MSEIQKTKNYDQFKFLECNRKISEAHLKWLVFSIQAQNMLKFRPILVDSDMNVIDGQHRLEAAKRLNTEIFYQVNKKAEISDIMLINAGQKRWKREDYIHYYASLGNENYIKLREYIAKEKRPPTVVIKLIGCESGTMGDRLKMGTFVFPNQEVIDQYENKKKNVDRLLETMKRYVIVNNKFLDSNRLLMALVAFLTDPRVDVEILIHKLTLKSDAIKPCIDAGGYYAMVKNIYNWKNQDPLD